MNCPQCQQTLSPPPAGRRLACSFCGWVEAPPADEPLARKAEEIARERQMDTEPVWRYLLIGLGALTLLVLGFNTLVGAFQKNRASRKVVQESPMPQFSPPAMIEAQPTALGANPDTNVGASPGTNPGASPAPSVDPNAPASLDPAAQASAQASSVAAAANAAENGQPLPGTSPVPGTQAGTSPLPPGMSAPPGASAFQSPDPNLSPAVNSGASAGSLPASLQPGQAPVDAQTNGQVAPPPLPGTTPSPGNF